MHYITPPLAAQRAASRGYCQRHGQSAIIEAKKTLIVFSVAAISLASTAANLVLIGDSTLAPRSAAVKLGSWGDALKPSLAPGNGIVNRAVGGRTVRTTKPGWTNSLAQISKGDFVIIQFGIKRSPKS